MTFPILGGNGAVAGYSIDNSLRFNDDDSAHLDNTFSTTTNRKTYSYSTWIKRSVLDGANQHIFGVYIDGNNHSLFRFDSGEKLDIRNNLNASLFQLDSDMVFRDTSAWYHILIVTDTTEATASDRIKVYVNGTQITLSGTYPTLNKDTYINDNRLHTIAEVSNGTEEFDGYLAETHFIDGQALSPTDFGEFDEDSGIWKPIEYTGTYGTNGFYLDFENSGSLGADQSGNGNNFTPTNLASTDQMIDTPTRNFCTMNPLDRLNIGGANSEQVTSEGNLKSTGTGSEGRSIGSTFAITPNGISKAYAEWYSVSGSTSKDLFYSNNINGYIANDDATAGNIVMMAVDCVAGKYWFGNNGTWDASGDPANGTNPTGTFTANSDVQFGHRCYDSSRSQVVNFGQDSTFAGNTTRQSNTDSNGEGDFYYTPPTGFLSLNSSNLSTEASPTIDDGSQYFNTLLYTGNGSNPRTLTGVGFNPDFVWIKNRTVAYGHGLADSSRGTSKTLISNSTVAEQTNYSYGFVSAFSTDGFGVNAGASGDNFVNETGNNYVAWNWLANGGTTSSNTDGSITSTVQANTTSGFSIVTFTGDGNDNASVGHGLGVTPEIIIIKNRDAAQGWVFNANLSSKIRMNLNTTNADLGDFTFYMGTQTSSNIVFGNNHPAWNGSGNKMVAYVFHSVEGYSKMGLYTGNGSSDGVFVYTGFRPAIVIQKSTSQVSNWVTYDNKRPEYNVQNKPLYPNLNNAEGTSTGYDFVSNGFKLRTSGGLNSSGHTYIYMAFAENPFVSSSGVPVVAR